MKVKIKRIIGSVAFLLILCIALVPLSYALRTNSAAKELLTPFYALEENSIDVCYLGSSAVYRYYVPPMQWKAHGYTSYNFATAGQPFVAAIHDIKEIEKTQDPALYVIELRMHLVKQNYLLTNTDNKPSSNEMHYNDIVNGLRYSENRAELVEKLFPGDLTWQIDILRNHVNWKSLDLWKIKNAIKPQWDDTMGVFTQCKHKVVKDTTVTAAKTKIKLHQFGYDTLDEICNYLDEIGKDALFLVSPYVEPEKPEQQERMMAIADETERYVTEKGYKFLNLCYKNQELGLDYSKDFYNHRHVNTIGAQKVTNYIGDYIAKNYDIKRDHSADTVSKWDSAYDKWLKIKDDQEEIILDLIENPPKS